MIEDDDKPQDWESDQTTRMRWDGGVLKASEVSFTVSSSAENVKHFRRRM